MNKTDFNLESHDRQNGYSLILSCSKMRCSKTRKSCTILKILTVVMFVMMFGCSSSSITQSYIEKSYRALLAKQFKSDAKYYQITKFKKELVLEKTDKLYVVLVSYMLKINPAKKYVSTTNKMILESVIPGFTRNLLVFKKARAKWEIVDPNWKYKDYKSPKKPEHYVKLIIHSGYWQIKFFKDKYKNYSAYTISNAEKQLVAHGQRTREIHQRIEQGHVLPPCANLSKTGQARIIRYKKQFPVMLPRANSISLLVMSEHLMYGLDIVQPRKQAFGVPGVVHPVSIDASNLGTYNAYYYRLCGKDVEIGMLPIKIVPVVEFERHYRKNTKSE